jgi:hypothetical protein
MPLPSFQIFFISANKRTYLSRHIKEEAEAVGKNNCVMKTGCACLRARLLHGATGNRLFTLKLRLSLVSIPVPPKTTAMPIRRLAVNIEIHSWSFHGLFIWTDD